MPRNVWRPEELKARDDCFHANEPVFINIRGNQGSPTGGTLLTVGTWTPDQNYFIPQIAMALTCFDGAAAPAASGGYAIMTVGDTEDDSDVLGGVGNDVTFSKYATLICGMGNSVNQFFDFNPYGKYAQAGVPVVVGCLFVTEVGADISFVADVNLMVFPTYV